MSPNTDLSRRRRSASARGLRWDAQLKPGRALIWAPLSIGLIILVISATIALQVRESERAAISKAGEAALREVTGEFALRMESQVRALERMVGRWEYVGRFEKTDFEAEGLALVADFDDILAISWVDPSLIIRWIVPYAGSEKLVGMDVGAESAPEYRPHGRLSLQPDMTRGRLTIEIPHVDPWDMDEPIRTSREGGPLSEGPSPQWFKARPQGGYGRPRSIE